MAMEFLRKTSAFCNMAEYGEAFVPNIYVDGLSSMVSILFMTEIFSNAMEISNNTPLSPWKQRVIFLSPLAIGMLPSFHRSNKTIQEEPIGKHSDKKEEVAAAGPSQGEEEQSEMHIPLMIYDHAAKVFFIASVVIISEKKGYHILAGVAARGGLIHAHQQKVISKEVYLTTCIAIGVIGTFSSIVTDKSWGNRVIFLIVAIPKQLINIYQFPAIQAVCDAFFYEKLAEAAQENESIKVTCSILAANGFLDSERINL